MNRNVFTVVRDAGSICLAVNSIIILASLITRGKNALLDPHTIAVASTLDSINLIGVYKSVDNISDRVNTMDDSISLWMLELRCNQKYSMTLDQQVLAKNEFSELRRAWERSCRK